MAKEYGCDYELVQYKWPRWLHAQTEKQRIIWGYKILFLDVLFPLSVKKIIFVDADQVSWYTCSFGLSDFSPFLPPSLPPFLPPSLPLLSSDCKSRSP